MQMELFTEKKQTDSKARIKELRRKPHTFWNDPGHGWLEVELSDLNILGIRDKISKYSYRYNNKAYLEEDMDATTYIKALWGEFLDSKGNICSHAFQAWRGQLIDTHQESIFIRNLPHF